MNLGIDPDELAMCVQCGLCLPHCPTFRVTGDESRSPRGRIAVMRALQDDGAPLTDGIRRSLETCIQCRGCETACPSGVPYGHLIEPTRAALAGSGDRRSRLQRAAFAPLTRPRLLRAGSRLLAVAQRLGAVPARLALPRLPLRSRPLVASGDDVWLFTGCVMDAWQREVHADTKAVLEAAGFGVAPSGDAAACCGALHTHAGLGAEARRAAQRVVDALPGDAPVIVDSAGCGAALKDYGHLLATPEAAAFSARVFDAAEFLAGHMDRLPSRPPLEASVAVQDPCHLRHVQRAHLATRTVLAPYVRRLVELDDDGLCCGAGGAWSMLEPELAGLVRDRKVAAIGRSGADLVVSANPGCSMHLAAGGSPTVHPMTVLARVLATAPD